MKAATLMIILKLSIMKKENGYLNFRLLLVVQGLILINSCEYEEGPITATDIDGNVYHAVIIGTQVWTIENLKTTRYRNGDPVSYVTDNTEWSSLTEGGYCFYNNMEGNKKTYGSLYNWYAANDSRNIAPEGWHVPTDAEWQSLIQTLGPLEGGKLKEAGFNHWAIPNSYANNTARFRALPGGYRLSHGSFSDLSYAGYWWTSTEFDSVDFRALYHNKSSLGSKGGSDFRTAGFSVRCIKD